MKKKIPAALLALGLMLTFIACVMENDPTKGGTNSTSGTAASRDGPLTVKFTFTEKSKAIDTVTISAVDSDYYYSKSDFAGAAAKIKADGKIDNVSGATTTSKAINAAVAQALAEAKAQGLYTGTVDPTPVDPTPVDPTPPAVAKHAPWRETSTTSGITTTSLFTGQRTSYTGGTVTAVGNEDVSNDGIDQDANVKVTLTFNRGIITEVTFNPTNVNAGDYVQENAKDKERIIAINSPEFDTKTGATFTSRAVRDAAWDAINNDTLGTSAPLF
jgi:uncharacterized protein with FMN-binding domain